VELAVERAVALCAFIAVAELGEAADLRVEATELRTVGRPSGCDSPWHHRAPATMASYLEKVAL